MDSFSYAGVLVSLFEFVPDTPISAFSNQDLWLALLAIQMGMSTASGAMVLVSSLLVTTCCVKYHHGILAVLSVLER